MSNFLLFTPNYSKAEVNLMAQAADGFIRLHPLMGQISKIITRHRGPVRILDEKFELNQHIEKLSQTMSLSFEIIRNSAIEQYTILLTDFASGVVGQDSSFLYDQFNKITDATGMVFDAKGEKSFFEMRNEFLDTYPLDFDEAGNPNLPAVFSPDPATIEKLKKLTPTEAEQKVFEELIESKKAEFNAKKRTRRLS